MTWTTMRGLVESTTKQIELLVFVADSKWQGQGTAHIFFDVVVIK